MNREEIGEPGSPFFGTGFNSSCKIMNENGVSPVSAYETDCGN